MKELIEALTIFSKYTDAKYPTACEHDVLYIDVAWGDVDLDDIVRLEELGFIESEFGCFMSYRFGSN